MTTKSRSVAVSPASAALAATLLSALCASPLGRLVDHFHLTYQLAGFICTLIANGAFYYISIFYPFIIPAEITIGTLLKVFGTAYAIGW